MVLEAHFGGFAAGVARQQAPKSQRLQNIRTSKRWDCSNENLRLIMLLLQQLSAVGTMQKIDLRSGQILFHIWELIDKVRSTIQ
jgi:hypothetical protein